LAPWSGAATAYYFDGYGAKTDQGVILRVPRSPYFRNFSVADIVLEKTLGPKWQPDLLTEPAPKDRSGPFSFVGFSNLDT
jgi:hypothetical protein